MRAAASPFKKAGSLLRGHAAGAAGLHEELWALRDVSFDVKQGEVVGLIGRNGAGKSTLLKILSRITEPTEGRAQIRGRVGSLLEVGTGFSVELTGRENVMLNAAILGMGRKELRGKFDEIVAFAEVERFIDTPVKHYSSGMYMRLAFAVAAHLDPEVLLVDEVLAVGDAAFQEKCLGKMQGIAGEGRTVIFVSHDMGAVTSLCPQSVCLEGGRVVDVGETGAVVAEYLSRWSSEIPHDGFADLRERARTKDHEARSASLAWIRVVNSKGVRTSTLWEGEPGVIEIGATFERETTSARVECAVFNRSGNMILFDAPSPEYPLIGAGERSFSLRLDPNFLTSGDYLLMLRLYLSGSLHDWLKETVLLSVVSRPPEDGELRPKQNGFFSFNYPWDAPRQLSVGGQEMRVGE